MTPDERRRLIDDLLEGELSEADFLRLEAELLTDPQARRDYYNRVALTQLLEHEATGAPSLASQHIPDPTEVAVSGRQWRRAFLGMALASAVLLMVVVLQWRSPANNPLDSTQRPGLVEQTAPDVENVVSGFAVISGQADAVWEANRALPAGSLVPTGELHLKSGLVQLELFSGVLLVIEGDARFSILSPMEVAVSHGKVRARVPEPAHGFRIQTNSGEVVDLGTEFAVSVTAAGSEVHVLDGEVDWQPMGSTTQRLRQGEAAGWTKEGQTAELTARTQDFVGPNELRKRVQSTQVSHIERWKKNSETLRQDRRLVAYYQVALSDLSERRLANLAEGRELASSAGAVVAAALAPNRWGQPNGALDFSPAGSRVRLTVPGDHRSLTLLCWVKINSLDRWYNSLFLTDGHEEHEPHWQIMDDGRLFFSVKKRDQFDRSRGELDKHVYYSPPFWTSALCGQWLMIATVYDVDAKQVTHFLNGDVLSEEAIPEEYLVETVRIGNASLCNWDLPKWNAPRYAVRNLNGSLDEFALFSAALSAEEIKRLYHDGKP